MLTPQEYEKGMVLHRRREQGIRALTLYWESSWGRMRAAVIRGCLPTEMVSVGYLDSNEHIYLPDLGF